MKALTKLLWFLGVVIVPLGLIYFKSSDWTVISTDTLIGYLNNYRLRLGEDASSNIEFQSMFLKGLIIVVGLISTKRLFINERRSGMKFNEKSGDFYLTSWSIIKTLVIYTVLYFVATYLKINSDRLLESFTVILVSVPLGIIFKLWNTQLWYEYNNKKRTP